MDLHVEGGEGTEAGSDPTSGQLFGTEGEAFSEAAGEVKQLICEHLNGMTVTQTILFEFDPWSWEDPHTYPRKGCKSLESTAAGAGA